MSVADSMEPHATDTNTKIPLALKLVLTAFMLVLVPFYWQAYAQRRRQLAILGLTGSGRS